MIHVLVSDRLHSHSFSYQLSRMEQSAYLVLACVKTSRHTNQPFFGVVATKRYLTSLSRLERTITMHLSAYPDLPYDVGYLWNWYFPGQCHPKLFGPIHHRLNTLTYLNRFISIHRLVVGAPVADSTFSGVNKPGAIFKCSVSNKGSCQEIALGLYFFLFLLEWQDV